jgi:hypothetical protein
VSVPAKVGAKGSITVSARKLADDFPPVVPAVEREQHTVERIARLVVGHLEIGRGHSHPLAFRLEQDIGEDRERLARLHDVLHHLEAFEECVTVEQWGSRLFLGAF